MASFLYCSFLKNRQYQKFRLLQLPQEQEIATSTAIAIVKRALTYKERDKEKSKELIQGASNREKSYRAIAKLKNLQSDLNYFLFWVNQFYFCKLNHIYP